MKENKEELVSIIVPVYNASKFIKETISTVQNQTYTNWELLLVNDCSKDDSVDIIKEYMKKDKRIKLFEQEQNGGAALARNRGIKESSGKYLCFLDSDDLWDNNKLEKQVKFMELKKCAFSYTSYEFADKECKPTGKKVIAKEKLTYKQCLKNNIISTITVMFNMNLIDKNFIQMPNLKYVEDTATWWKILRHGYIAYGIPDIFSYYRRIPNTNSSNKLRTQRYLWSLYRNEENLCFVSSIYYLTMKNINAIKRRI